MIPIGLKLFVLLSFMASALLLALRAEAQTINGGRPDLSGYATTTDMTTAVSTMTAAIPPACTVAPIMDALNGVLGTSTPCVTRPDSARPTAVQALNTTIAADCSWSATFARAFLTSSPIIQAKPVIPSGSTQPILCEATTRSTTTQSGKCFLSQSTTLAAVTVLSISVAIGSQVVTPFTASGCTAGTPLMVTGRDPSQ